MVGRVHMGQVSVPRAHRLNMSADLTRLLSLELGRPVLIDDRDCDVDLPSPLDDRFIQASGMRAPPDAPEPTGSLLVTVYVVHCISRVIKLLRSPCIASSTLRTFDRQFDTCMAAFPPHWRFTGSRYLEPQNLAPMIYLQNARISLHRHNLSPACSRDVRTAAIDGCVVVARDTLRLLSRVMQTPPTSPQDASVNSAESWQARLAAAAFSMLCTHVWRCVLFLCFRAEYKAALRCIHVNAAIGDLRPVNMACGRHLTLFLECLVPKLRRGEGGELEDDEELVTYLSGDIQSSSQNSWIWQDNAVDTNTNQTQAQQDDVAGGGHAGEESRPRTATEADDDDEAWGGWDRVEWILQHLVSDQEQQQQQSARGGQPSTSGSSSRISIANII